MIPLRLSAQKVIAVRQGAETNDQNPPPTKLQNQKHEGGGEGKLST